VLLGYDPRTHIETAAKAVYQTYFGGSVMTHVSSVQEMEPTNEPGKRQGRWKNERHKTADILSPRKTLQDDHEKRRKEKRT